jgi:cytochrome c553
VAGKHAIALTIAATCGALSLHAVRPLDDAPPKPGTVDFGRDVKPILEANCYRCHGPDKSRADLRLDLRARALAGAKAGTEKVIVAGDALASELYVRVTSTDDDERMPQGADPLSAQQIATLRAWLDQGANWPDEFAGTDTKGRDHWAYKKPVRPPPPSVANAAWVRNPIDAFVLARLEREGLAPAPEADRATLLRRLCIDLTGLPPSPEEVDAFVADASADAYDKVVERLLASPHYGERMARAWLDLARYADTNGYEKDAKRTMWRYRDWVIDAFNANMPFDRFTVAQIAGDLLPNATLEDRIATGFERNTMLNDEGGIDPEEFRAAAVIDRVNTTATVWMGTTLACAQCHDHKFDPFTQRDYYSLFAVLNGTAENGRDSAPMIPAPTPEQAREEQSTARELHAVEARIESVSASLDVDQARWESATLGALPPPTDWRVLRATEAKSPRGTTLATQGDGSLLAGGATPDTDVYELTFEPGAMRVTALRVEALPDPSLPNNGPGRASNGNFVLSSLTAICTTPGIPSGNETLRFVAASADFEQATFGAARVLSGEPNTGWAVDGCDHKLPHAAVFACAEPVEIAADSRLHVELRFDYRFERHVLGRVRISLADDAALAARMTGADKSAHIPTAVENALRIASGARDDKQSQAVREYFRRSVSADGVGLYKALDAARASHKAASDAIPTMLVLEELKTPRETHIFTRGSFLSPGAVVSPNIPALFGNLDASNEPPRLAFARWLCSDANPLAARVTVNRLWEHVFGRGLVAAPEDFGTRSEPPANPELLDWLAVEFAEHGWDIKALLREIVTSATYRQSSDATPASLERDPYGTLLSRGARFRVEGELVRDIALAAAGLLAPKIGGPSAYPPQPAGIWNSAYNSDDWKTDTGEGRYRRGLYTFWKRTAPYATFALFEAPSREFACTRRARTNTPLQALALLDDPAFVEASIALARRMLREAAASDEARVVRGFRICTSREPAEKERDVLVALARDARREFEAAPERAKERAGGAMAADELDPVEVAAWTSVASVLLNLDETLTRH